MDLFTYALAYFKTGETEVLVPELAGSDAEMTVTLKKELFAGRHFDRVRIISEWTKAEAGEEGYFFYPGTCAAGCALTRFREREDAAFDSLISAMPIAGLGGCERACMVHVTGMPDECRFHVEVNRNHYSLSPEFVLDGDEPDGDIMVEYRLMPGADYSAIAREYRAWQLAHGCRPLQERAKEREAVRYAAEAPEIRVRMGWKEVPTPVRCQTDATEPPVQVVCDVEKLRKLTQAMKRHGVEKAEICLVGWGKGGHDGRFPQQVPSDPAFGGDEALKEWISQTQRLGYKVVCHTGSYEAYDVADNFDRNLLVHRRTPDGLLRPVRNEGYARSGGLSGGFPWLLCPQTAYEKYAVEDLPKVRAYGFEGLHFVDELTACVPLKCTHPEHAVSRTQAVAYYRKIARLCTRLFGGFQSEAWIDSFASDVDYVMYTSFRTHLSAKDHPLFDAEIPLWQLVYHGIILSNASSTTVNYPIKEKDEQLRYFEYGSRPLLYIHSKFGSHKNWMGDADLSVADDAQIERSAAVIAQACREWEPLKKLQYEYMDTHEEVLENVFEITYSDGTHMLVNYGESPAEWHGHTVGAKSWITWKE